MDPTIFGWAAIGPVVSFIIVLPITVKLKDNSLVDLGWALGYVLMAWITFLTNGIKNSSWSLRQILITSLVTVWGIRLITYIAVRKAIRKTEDQRFVKYRERWKKNFVLKSFLVIFVPQMFIVYIIGSPVIFANSIIDSTFIPSLHGIILLAIGGTVWLEGFFFETLGDIQLMNFRKNPENKGKTLSSGLWKFTRHPNYFGESEQWWGIFIIAISFAFDDLSNVTQIIVGWVTILGPILLTLLLVKFSGVPTLENDEMLAKREGYKEYIDTTSSFIPWFPKKKKT